MMKPSRRHDGRQQSMLRPSAVQRIPELTEGRGKLEGKGIDIQILPYQKEQTSVNRKTTS